MPSFNTANLENLIDPMAGGSLKKLVFNGSQEEPEPNQISGCTRHLHIYVTPEQSCDPLSHSPYKCHRQPMMGVSNQNEDADLSLEVTDIFDDARSESMSGGSEVGANDLSLGRQIERSSLGDFFDANDDFSSDGSTLNGFKIELHATKLAILEEIERTRAAEETLALMRIQWERISNLMSEAGFTFPAIELQNSSTIQLSEEIFVARFVAETVGRGQAHAEAEEAAALIIESKDQEILRLQDKLHYYETVNHELSQRKLVEVACRQQARRRSRHRRWLWSFMGLSIAVGASLVAYSYILHPTPSLESGELSDSSYDT